MDRTVREENKLKISGSKMLRKIFVRKRLLYDKTGDFVIYVSAENPRLFYEKSEIKDVNDGLDIQPEKRGKLSTRFFCRSFFEGEYFEDIQHRIVSLKNTLNLNYT